MANENEQEEPKIEVEVRPPERTGGLRFVVVPGHNRWMLAAQPSLSPDYAAVNIGRRIFKSKADAIKAAKALLVLGEMHPPPTTQSDEQLRSIDIEAIGAWLDATLDAAKATRVQLSEVTGQVAGINDHIDAFLRQVKDMESK